MLKQIQFFKLKILEKRLWYVYVSKMALKIFIAFFESDRVQQTNHNIMTAYNVLTCFCLVIMSQSSTSDFLMSSGNSILTSGLEGEESL